MDTVKLYLLDVGLVARNESAVSAYIDGDRLKKASRYVKGNDRLLSLGGGYLIKKFVGETYIDERGKPRSETAFFNISHSGGVVGLALLKARDIGLDIECEKEIREELVKYSLSFKEYEKYLGGEPFLSQFVAKESLAKAEGGGISNELKIIPALPLNGEVVYLGKRYARRTFVEKDLFISVSVEGGEFKLETVWLNETDFPS